MVDEFFKARGRARSFIEIQYVIGVLRPCPDCGEREIGEIDELDNMPPTFTFETLCPCCNAKRRFAFAVMGNVYSGRFESGEKYEIGVGASEVITSGELEAELRRLGPLTIVEPTSLDSKALDEAWPATYQAIVTVNELVKFPDPSPFAVAERERLQRRVETFEVYGKQLLALSGYKEPRGHFGREEYRAHEAWLKRGRTGEGRFEVENLSVEEVRLTAAELTAARLEHFSAKRAALVGVTLDEAELIDCKLPGTNLREIELHDATLIRCELWQADMTMAKLTRATVIDCDLSTSNQRQATWTGAVVRNCKFNNALFADSRLAGAKFSGCEMRGALFADGPFPDLATTDGAVFEDCDLRETTWTGRDLSGVQFLRCKLEGATGMVNALIED